MLEGVSSPSSIPEQGFIGWTNPQRGSQSRVGSATAGGFIYHLSSVGYSKADVCDAGTLTPFRRGTNIAAPTPASPTPAGIETPAISPRSLASGLATGDFSAFGQAWAGKTAPPTAIATVEMVRPNMIRSPEGRESDSRSLKHATDFRVCHQFPKKSHKSLNRQYLRIFTFDLFVF
jgi:hypothetical protein